MNSQDVQRAVARSGVEESRIDWALDVTLPVLKELAEDASGFRRLWLRWGMNALIDALKSYRESVAESD